MPDIVQYLCSLSLGKQSGTRHVPNQDDALELLSALRGSWMIAGCLSSRRPSRARSLSTIGRRWTSTISSAIHRRVPDGRSQSSELSLISGCGGWTSKCNATRPFRSRLSPTSCVMFPAAPKISRHWPARGWLSSPCPEGPTPRSHHAGHSRDVGGPLSGTLSTTADEYSRLNDPCSV